MQNYNKEWQDDFFLKHGICHATYMRNQNREKFRAYRREQVPCELHECGKTIRRDAVTAHKKTKTHIDILAKNITQVMTELTPKV